MRKIIEDFVDAYKHCATQSTEESIYRLYDCYEILDSQDTVSYEEIIFIINELKNDFADDGSLDDSLAEYLYYHLDKLSYKSTEIFYVNGKSNALCELKHLLTLDNIEYNMKTFEYRNISINITNFEEIVKQLNSNNIVLDLIDIRYILSHVLVYVEDYSPIIDHLKEIINNCLESYEINNFGELELIIINRITT